MRSSLVLGGAVVIAVAGFVGGRVTASGTDAAHAAGSPYSTFVGKWFQHGGVLQVFPGGQGIYHYRTYIDCSQTIPTACDRIIGNTIYPGGFIRFSLTRAAGAKAFGSVSESSLSYQVGVPLSLTFGAAKDTVTLKVPGSPGRLCGPHSPAGLCGA